MPSKRIQRSLSDRDRNFWTFTLGSSRGPRQLKFAVHLMPSSQIFMASFYLTRSRVEITLPCSSPVTNAEEDKKSSQTYCGSCVQPTPTSFAAPFDNDEELPAAELAAGVASRCLDTSTRRPHNRCRPNAKR